MSAAASGTHQRFWSKVYRGPAGACWIWLGAIADDGYGRYFLHDGAGGMVRPHRYAYTLTYETELEELGELMHVCDVPICVNPEHLAPGTHADNMRGPQVPRATSSRDGGPLTRPARRGPSPRVDARARGRDHRRPRRRRTDTVLAQATGELPDFSSSRSARAAPQTLTAYRASARVTSSSA